MVSKFMLFQVYAISHCGISSAPKSMSILQCLRHIVQNEGSRALFKGWVTFLWRRCLAIEFSTRFNTRLSPSLENNSEFYFIVLDQTSSVSRHHEPFTFVPTVRPKKPFRPMGKHQTLLTNQERSHLSPFDRFFSVDSPFSHILSASCAGFVSSTATNPIWFVKTRLQLDYDSRSKMNVRQCIQKIYETNGLRGFYKGITASYFGISETVVHFVIYEALKKKLVSQSFHPLVQIA